MAGTNPTELIELPLELQREVESLSIRDGAISYYELLGVPADASPAAIHRAYLERSRRFHPDAWYGKSLGPFAAMMSRLFQRMATADQLLADPEARAAYDRDSVKLFSAEERAQVARRQAQDAGEVRRARESRERLMRMKGFARLGAARQLYEQALRYSADGQQALAVESLKAARELDPQRKEIALKLTALEKEQAKARLASALASAKDRESSGDLTAALKLYSSALRLEPNSVQAALAGARCAEAASDLNQMMGFALRACQAEPKNLDAHILAARAFAGLSQKKRAKAELELVLSQRPDHPEAKALLARL